MYDYDVSNLHTYSDNIIWDSHGGYYGDYVHGDAPMLDATRFTIGKIRGTYSGPDGQGSAGSGFFIGPGTGGTKVAGMVTNSIFVNNPFYGLADYATGDYNALSNNAAGNYGGKYTTPPAGSHDVTSDISGDLKYLPRIEAELAASDRRLRRRSRSAPTSSTGGARPARCGARRATTRSRPSCCGRSRTRT